MSAAPRKLVVALVACMLALTPLCEAKRALSGSNRKTSSGGGYSTRRQPSTSVTKPSYETNSGSNSHADVAKLSYPNYNSQPNRPAGGTPANNQPIGWNVPSQSNAGPPPSYSAANVAGGAKTNMHEPPPSYHSPNYAAPPPSYNNPNYAAAPPSYHNPNYAAPPPSYHNPNYAAPPPNYNQAMGTHYGPPGATYYPSSQGIPQGATYLPAGSSLPAGTIIHSAPPQQTSSGLGFGSGLAAGAIGGAILGHVLTPTQTRVVEQAPAAAGGASDGGHDRIIIINNGQPVNATDANGVTVINNGVTQAPVAAPGETPAPLAPIAPVPAGSPDMAQNATNAAETPMAPMAAPANPNQPPTGGIICVPIRVNETDPNDATKMIEVEKPYCYMAPPPQPQIPAEVVDPNKPTEAPATTPAEGSARLAPMQPIPAGVSSQQLQQPSAAIGDQTLKSSTDAAGEKEKGLIAFLVCFTVSYLLAYN